MRLHIGTRQGVEKPYFVLLDSDNNVLYSSYSLPQVEYEKKFREWEDVQRRRRQPC